MFLPNKKIFTSNIIIGVAIALFVYFLKQTSFLEYATIYLLKILLIVNYTLIRNRIHYGALTPGIAIDAVVIIIAAYLWTYFKSVPAKILGNILLAIALIPVTFFIFYKYGVLISSFLIVIGIILNITVEAVIDMVSNTLHLRLVEEKQEAEFSIVRHLNHNVKPNLQIAKSPINAVIAFLEERKLMDSVIAKRLDGSDETVGEALQNVFLSLNQINDILDNTRKLVAHEIRKEDFREVDIKEIFTKEIAPLYARTFPIHIHCGDLRKVRLHKESFVEAINNIIRNAEAHAFSETHTNVALDFHVSENRKNIIIDYTNNGKPFPANLDAKDFLSFGKKSNESPGEGLGGAWIGKVIEAHNGTFRIIRDDYPVHFSITLPKRGI
ncbi:MAG: ATP-binding [Geobacteraceae bacterium]|nr:MAG: ATP-binding [Geobacteraceae bacterium]